ncbi:MAG: type VI secretion system spike protein VgrG1b [Candidatus Zixiibacteriota bacterium]
MVPLAANEARFTFTLDGTPDNWEVREFKGVEAISRLFEFTIDLVNTDRQSDLRLMIGKQATLKFATANSWRYVDGIVRRIEEAGRYFGYFQYTVALVPSVWILTLRRNSRIFQDMTTKDIISKVLQDAGLRNVRFALSGTYTPRTYCVQYRETDWDFISRLMEEEGIFYFFEFKDNADCLVIGDSDNVHQTIKGQEQIVYREPGEGVEETDFVYEFRQAEQLRSGKVSLKDFNFETPSLSLLKDSAAEDDVELEVYDYPGLHADDSRAATLAKIRLEMAQSKRAIGHGRSQCPRIVAGQKFTLSEHPLTERNDEYLIISANHEGHQPLGEFETEGYRYNNHFECIPANVPFRPERVTPKPSIQGAQTAIVTGPAGEEIYTDQYGRIKVQFHWDREGKKDEKTSCWIRVAQLWAGQGWGAMFIPRIGHEVIVDFLEGDPDRPIVTGSVYHAENMPPYPLDDEKTKSTIKSNSTKGGEGFNEYRFEDLKGSEEIYQHAQKNLTIITENDKNQETKHDETLKIGNDRSKTVEHDERVSINNNRTESVKVNESITIGKNRTESVGENETISIGKNRSTEIGGNETITIKKNRTESVKEDETVTIEGKRTVEVIKEETVTLKKGRNEEIREDDKHKIEKTLVFDVGDEILLKTGDASIVMRKDGTIQIKGKDITISGSGKINVKASSNLVLKGAKIDAN